MKEVMLFTISSPIITAAIIYSWGKLFNIKINFKKYKIYLIFTLYSTVISINYIYNSVDLKFLFSTFFAILFCKLLFNQSLRKSIIVAIVCQIVMLIAETIFSLIIITFIKPDTIEQIMNGYMGTLSTNFIITFMSVLLMQLKFPYKFKDFLFKITDSIMVRNIIFLTMLFFVSVNILFIRTYSSSNLNILIIINFIITLIYAIIVARAANDQNKYVNICNKYNTTINSLKEYENILDKYKIENHENKNQLLVIRAMAIKKEVSLTTYIDTLIKEKIEDNEKFMFDTSKIPNGGLRGLVYSKMLTTKDKNINFTLNIDKKVSTFDLIELGDKNIVDLCKIIGVFLDNAIEAVEEIEKKFINISMYKTKDDFTISISNNYIGYFDINKADIKGYTTKGKDHGYGLSLVKEIIDNNSDFTNYKKIDKDVFTQILNVKLK